MLSEFQSALARDAAGLGSKWINIPRQANVEKISHEVFRNARPSRTHLAAFRWHRNEQYHPHHHHRSVSSHDHDHYDHAHAYHQHSLAFRHQYCPLQWSHSRFVIIIIILSLVLITEAPTIVLLLSIQLSSRLSGIGRVLIPMFLHNLEVTTPRTPPPHSAFQALE